MPTTIEISTLGQFQVQLDGQTRVEFISIKAKLLLIYLALHPGEHSRKKLASIFWSETNDEQALKNLRTILSSVRQNLPAVLIVERDLLAINPEITLTVDAIQFEQRCAAALAALDAPDALSHMQQIAELYQGSFLADVAFRDAVALDEWIGETQRHLHHLYARLLHEIVTLAEAQAAYEIGSVYARRLVNLDPYWDTARRHLMRLLTFLNRANEALREYEAFAQLLDEELGTAPEAETTTLVEQIRNHHIRLPAQRATQSLIVLPDVPFVEALDDIALVQRMLNTPQCRLLTIYGITGIGKTALATQIAFHRQQLYRDGAHLILLRQAQSARDLAYQIACVLGIEISNQTSAQELETLIVQHVQDRHLLLVLDNYEHLLPATDLVQTILERAPKVQVLITSQVPLNLFREWLLPLQGLRVPAPDSPDAATFEAVRLFELTAQRVNPRFTLDDNLADVVEICRLVDGLPLALIIAAGWTQIIPVNKIKAYIIEGREFSLPVHHDLPPHHQSLDLMLDHTWNALNAQEQYALTALSIFSTSFGIEEVTRVCVIDLDVLLVMIQKSLIQKFDDLYRMHPLIWRYARRKLLFSDQREALGERYTTLIVQRLSALQQQRLALHDYLAAIELDYALIWNYEWMPKALQPQYMLAVSRFLIAYWEISRSAQVPALHQLFREIAPADLTPELRMLLHLQLARFALLTQQPERAEQQLHLCLSEYSALAPFADWSVAFNIYSHLTSFAHPDQVAALAADEDSRILSSSYHKLLALYLDMRDYDATASFFLYLANNIEQPLDVALILATWGAVSAESGQLRAAHEHFTAALHHLDATDHALLKRAVATLAQRAAGVGRDVA